MSINVNTGSDSLELARARQKAAEEAKAKAEQNKTSAETTNTQATSNVTAKETVATNANAVYEKENADVTLAQEKANSANLKVNSMQSAYTNALNQLTQAQASGDENAIARAEEAANRAYEQLQLAQQEANTAKTELERELQEANEAKQKVETAEQELEKAQQETVEAKANLEKAEAEFAAATKELEEANAALEEASAAAAAEEAEKTEGVQEAEHLSQEEIDKLVNEEGYTYITSKEQFLQIFQNGEIDLNGKYILGCDIDLSDIENWIPVGDNENPFTGIFNGNGYSIDNLTINVTDSNAKNVGFFGVTENATISNVDFNNANIITPTDFINGSSSVGIVAGTARGTTFDNINVSGQVSGYESVGGLVGTINDNSYIDETGNIVEIGNSAISNVTTFVDAQGKYFVGGLIGSVEDTNTCEGVATRDLRITNCSTSGNIVFDEEAAGGFIGQSGKTIITINNCESNVNIKWNNNEYDGDLSFLMETGRAGGFIGCVDGSYVAFCNSTYTGQLDVDGEFKSEYYGWYMNDAHVTMYELPGGLPVDDILNIDGIDGLTPVTDPQTGISSYQITVSTLTGLDKLVTMLQANPALADIITFNVTFDFETMDGMYDSSTYAQYGVTQHLYEDNEGNIHNDVYIDNEIDTETTFHNSYSTAAMEVEIIPYGRTMVNGLYKDDNGNYLVHTSDGYKDVNFKFDTNSQITTVTKRLDTDEVRYREYLTQMVQYYQQKMYNAIKELFELKDDDIIPTLNKAEYKKLLKMQEAGMELTKEQQAAIALYEVDYTVANKVADVTKNYGCGMGGNASFLDETKTIHLSDDQGRPLFTTLAGDELRQRVGEDGTLQFDDEGNPVYEYLDGSDYDGFAEVFAKRAYPKTDEEGNFLYTDKDGNTVTKTTDENGNTVYKNADGTDFEGSEEDLEQQLEEYNITDNYNNLQNDMKDLLNDVENGKYPLGRNSEDLTQSEDTQNSQSESETNSTESTDEVKKKEEDEI